MSFLFLFQSRMTVMVLLLCLALLAGCSGWKPTEDKPVYNSSYKLTADGHYSVRRGDTLHAIAFNFGMDWRDIASWNNIRSPYTIYPDQELRLTGPKARHSTKPATRPATSSVATTTENSAAKGKSSSNKTVVTAAPAKGATSITYEPSPKPVAGTAAGTIDPGSWLWPAEGRVISNFRPNDPARKGIDIGGKEGQAVIASASGEVVYSGSGLIGYGELIIIKHSERLLSAYAHNRKRLVAEGQKVAGGERIAEMGKTDRNQAMLHFEIRLNGNPQDPLKYLPGR
jgi:lipoprotein NlpD